MKYVFDEDNFVEYKYNYDEFIKEKLKRKENDYEVRRI